MYVSWAMGNKRIKQKRKEKELARLDRQGRVVKGVVIPEGALPADPDAQDHGGGYAVKFSYSDIEYECAGCGEKGVWTAHQQKKYFEDQKGNIYNEPKWCFECHRQSEARRNPTSDQSGESTTSTRSPLASTFVKHVERLVAGETFDLHDTFGAPFEGIAAALFGSLCEEGVWYDGVVELTAVRRKKTQVLFGGLMWVAKGQGPQWKERFSAKVTDKRATKQGVRIHMKIGDFEAEGDVYELI